jgi:hypothetical protein
VLALPGADRTSCRGAGRAWQKRRKPGLITALLHLYNPIAPHLDAARFCLCAMQRTLFRARSCVDPMFTTLLEALFTNVFDARRRLQMRSCLWRACIAD